MPPDATEHPPRYGALLLAAAALWMVGAALLGLALIVLSVMVVLLIPDLMSFGDEPSVDGEPWWGWAGRCAIGAGAAFLLAVPLDVAAAVQAVRRLRRPGQERTWPILVLAAVGICSALPLLLSPVLLLPELHQALLTAGPLWLAVGMTARLTVAVHGIIDLAGRRP